MVKIYYTPEDFMDDRILGSKNVTERFLSASEDFQAQSIMNHFSTEFNGLTKEEVKTRIKKHLNKKGLLKDSALTYK